MSSREYESYRCMLTRCYNQNYPGYPNYGGRGVVVCAGWRESFKNFEADMGPAPEDHTLDRKDTENGGYWCGHCSECLERGWPANCQWATDQQQADTRRDTIRLEHKGETKVLREWAKERGMKTRTLYSRIYLDNWPVEEALETPVDGTRKKGAETRLEGEALLRQQACHAVHVETRTGRLPRPDKCSVEGCSETDIVAHHNGYDQEHWLDVVWVCRKHVPKVSDRLIEYNGRTLKLSEWARLAGMTKHVLTGRLESGWDMTRALNEPVRPKKVLELNGVSMTQKEWAKHLGVTEQTIINRLKANRPMEEVLSPHKQSPKKK